MGDDPIQGFGGRIVKRARVPETAILSIPFITVAVQYFLFLEQQGFGAQAAIEQTKKDWALISFVSAIPVVALALSRELQVHTALDYLVGARSCVGRHIALLMAQLAERAGYDHHDRIQSDKGGALRWFYSYANEPSALRTYAFEVWEGYYVGLYLSLASFIATICSLALALLFPARSFNFALILAAFLFCILWAVRRWITIPKIMKTAAQQIGEIRPTGQVLAEARHRFG